MTAVETLTVIDNLEDDCLDNHISRGQNYQKIQAALEKPDFIDVKDIERILKVCLHDFKEDKQYTAVILKVIAATLNRINEGDLPDHTPGLAQTALAIVNIIQTVNGFDSLKLLCFDTLLLYPNDTLVAVATSNEGFIENLNLYCQINVPLLLRLQAYKLLLKLLKIIPTAQKTIFVGRHISVWFQSVIPTAISTVSANGSTTEMLVEVLELLTDKLLDFDYTSDLYWQKMLESICQANKYPLFIKNLLAKGNTNWHRLWIVIIKLLKHQVTQSFGNIGIPINMMLPAVEAAFKVDVANRCRALECWNVLTDSFVTDINESNLNKRLKLLLVPLKSNNAKAEKTAIAKFYSWWHLIVVFENKMDKYLDSVLVSFLHFIYGTHNGNIAIAPGQMNENVKRHTVKAIVDLLGHVDCCGCTQLPRLTGKLVTRKHLVDNWNHWMYSITITIIISVTSNEMLTEQQLKCMWKSFLVTIGELPENNIRKDLFTEVLSIVKRLIQEPKYSEFIEMIMNAFVFSLFDDHPNIKNLMVTEADNSHLMVVLHILLDPCLDDYYNSFQTTQLVKKFKCVTRTIVNINYKHTRPNAFVIYNLRHTNITLKLWMALADTICESEIACVKVLSDILLYPLQLMDNFSDVESAGMSWYKLYNHVFPKLKMISICGKVMKYLSHPKTYKDSKSCFSLCVILAVLKNLLTIPNYHGYHNEIEILRELTNNIESYRSIEDIFPVLVDILFLIFSNLNVNKDDILTNKALQCLMNTLNILIHNSEKHTNEDHCSKTIGNVFNAVDTLLKKFWYYGFGDVIANELIKYTSILSKQSLLRNYILSLMKTIMSNTGDIAVIMKIKTSMNDIENAKAVDSELIILDTPSNSIVCGKNRSTSSNTKETIGNTPVESNVSENNLTTPTTKEMINNTHMQGNASETNKQSIPNTKIIHNDTVPSNITKSNKTGTSNLQEVINVSSVPQHVSENDKLTPYNKKKITSDTPVITYNTSVQSNVSENKHLNPLNTQTPKNIVNDSSVLANNIPAQSNVIENDKFTAPNTKELPKKQKKKEPSIVNTVVENGEEYVVVKSNWKFNPRKLTENQKEKLKRKREDIPALYQDLSQSQDEFKLVTWKTDSQDTSNTNSNSTKAESMSNKPNNEEYATSILKNLPSSNVVPNIMENFLLENVKTDKANSSLAVLSNESNKINPCTPKTTKSPHMALKDRVSRNVKNLREKSTLQNENEDTSNENETESMVATTIPANNNEKLNKTEILKTPTSMKPKKNDNIVNSAPPLISVDRPSRVKKMPKKFCDVELLALRKRRNTQHDEHVKFGRHTVEIHPIKDSTKPDSPPVENNVDDSSVIVNTNTQVKEVPRIADIDIHQNNENGLVLQVEGIVTPTVLHVEGNNEKRDTENCVVVLTKSDVNKTRDKSTSENSNLSENSNITENQKDKCEVYDVELSTPKKVCKTKDSEQKSTQKKKKSRNETNRLAIDMVEGFLTIQPGTRGRRKGLPDMSKKSKSDNDNNNRAKSDKKNKEKVSVVGSANSITLKESQESFEVMTELSPEDLPNSEDVIESSQDSTFSTVSVKSTKPTPKPCIIIEKLNIREKINESQSILDCGVHAVSAPRVPNDSKDDIELSQNKTAFVDKSFEDLTENMDTEPMDDRNSDDVIIIDDDPIAPMTVSSEDTVVGPESQELAEADTQPTDTEVLMSAELPKKTLESLRVNKNVQEIKKLVGPDLKGSETIVVTETIDSENVPAANEEIANEKTISTPDDITRTLSESIYAEIEKESEVSSPLKNETQRKQDFLNNTIEISPIKTMSPDRDKKSPSPERSSDYVVIKLTSPVQSNGEPFERCGSPEFFTDDKVSPDKRDQSPPRQEVTVTNTSPSSSLSLKKNRPQVRSGGRGAQMLGLCVPDKVQNIISSEKNGPEVMKKSSPSTTARRNLRTVYVLKFNENNEEGAGENNDSENFLKFTKTLPAVDSSPSGPILKRKLAEITDEATYSPGSKRKRVSFHDPPVSTTVSVQKYIEPLGARSPQNSALKRLERQMRQHTPTKSPKRLENAFKLDTVLTKTIESFTDEELANNTDDTQPISLDETPSVEIVKASELNDSQPICPELIHCKDPIDVIATELSSPAMKSLLVKELEGKIESVGDLAKMTELEVNRLCIKAPKVKVAKKVLTDYAAKSAVKPQDETVSIDEAMFDVTMNEPVPKNMDIGIQTEIECIDMEIQTTPELVTFASVQTEVASTSHMSIQTNESGYKSTADIINTCILERSDFVAELRDYICERFDSKDLILFCSQILQKVHDKPA